MTRTKAAPLALVIALVASAVLSPGALASDGVNLCRNAPGDPSANVSLPKDDTYHYETEPLNGADPLSGFETDFKAWHWRGFYRGRLERFDGYRFFFAIQLPDLSWVKVAIVNLIGPDGVQSQHLRFEPGQYAAPENAYDLSIGNWRATGSGGHHETEDFASDDGAIEVHVVDEALKNPSYPFFDAYGAYQDPDNGEVLGTSYYWARPLLSSLGVIEYRGATVPVFGTAWQDRQWQFVSGVKWNWASIQLDNGMTLAAYDIRRVGTGRSVLHTLNIEGSPGACESELLAAESNWTLDATGRGPAQYQGSRSRPISGWLHPSVAST